MIKNYTSSVPETITIARIEEALMKAGASGISKHFELGRVKALSFHAEIRPGKSIEIRLPANAESVFNSLKSQKRRLTASVEANLRAQSERTAWKLMQDWTEIQLSLIAMKQAEFIEIFLPFVWDGKQTYFAALKGDHFLALEGPKEKRA